MRKLPFMLIVAMVCFMSGCQTSRSQPHPNGNQASAAQDGLAALRQMINAHNYAALGFGSPDEVREATLGEPLMIYQVRLDALRRFNDQGNPETLLTDVRRSLYPVQVSGKVASSVFVTGAPEGWRATELGNPAVAKLVSQYRHSAGDFVVHVPALQSYFVADRVEGKLVLTPVMDDPRTGFRAGETLPAGPVFAALRKAASDYNGLPQ